MAQQDTQAARNYRATYHPKDQHGHPVASESGVLPSVNVLAVNAEAAALQAGAATGCVIANVERIEPEHNADTNETGAPALHRNAWALMLLGALAGGAHAADLACTKIGFQPGTPDPNKCVVVVHQGPTPAAQAHTLQQANRYADRGDARTLQAATTHADAGDARTLEAAQQHTAQRVAELDQHLSAGIAMAAAVQPLAPDRSGETTLNLGAATYGGQPALGIALAHQSGRTTFTAGAAGTSGSSRALVRVGLGWRF